MLELYKQSNQVIWILSWISLNLHEIKKDWGNLLRALKNDWLKFENDERTLEDKYENLDGKVIINLLYQFKQPYSIYG